MRTELQPFPVGTMIHRGQFDATMFSELQSHRFLVRCTILDMYFLPWSGSSIQLEIGWLSHNICATETLMEINCEASCDCKFQVRDSIKPLMAFLLVVGKASQKRGSLLVSKCLIYPCFIINICVVFSNMDKASRSGGQRRIIQISMNNILRVGILHT